MKQLTLIAVVASTLPVSLNAMRGLDNAPQQAREIVFRHPEHGPKEISEKNAIAARRAIGDFFKRQIKNRVKRPKSKF